MIPALYILEELFRGEWRPATLPLSHTRAEAKRSAWLREDPNQNLRLSPAHPFRLADAVVIQYQR